MPQVGRTNWMSSLEAMSCVEHESDVIAMPVVKVHLENLELMYELFQMQDLKHVHVD